MEDPRDTCICIPICRLIPRVISSRMTLLHSYQHNHTPVIPNFLNPQNFHLFTCRENQAQAFWSDSRSCVLEACKTGPCCWVSLPSPSPPAIALLCPWFTACLSSSEGSSLYLSWFEPKSLSLMTFPSRPFCPIRRCPRVPLCDARLRT